MTEQNIAEAVVPTQAAAPAEEIQDSVPEQSAAPAAEGPADADAPANPYAAPAGLPAAPKDRRKLFAALRWTAAALVFAAVGTGVAYGVTQPERTDIPGLSTKDDGRWAYPTLSKPTLPPGAGVPFAKDNPDAIHYAGLTQLLLPPPAGAGPDSDLKLEKDEAVTVDTFLAEYEPSLREEMKTDFQNEGLRQIVARGWITPDGTRTRVYLLRFHSSGFANAFKGCAGSTKLNGVKMLEPDPAWRTAESKEGRKPVISDYTRANERPSGVKLYQERKPVGDEETRIGCILSGDVRAVVLQTRKGEAAVVPFHQTVILQEQLLG